MAWLAAITQYNEASHNVFIAPPTSTQGYAGRECAKISTQRTHYIFVYLNIYLVDVSRFSRVIGIVSQCYDIHTTQNDTEGRDYVFINLNVYLWMSKGTDSSSIYVHL